MSRKQAHTDTHTWISCSMFGPELKHGKHSSVVCICRGSYEKALRELDKLAGVLPAAQELLQRLKVTDLQLACELLARQLRSLNVTEIYSIDTHMPGALLAKIYAQLLQQDFGELLAKLQHRQWLEQTRWCSTCTAHG